jgi:ribosome-associated toxin RatA of RatAB toxin-antitoxin module
MTIAATNPMTYDLGPIPVGRRMRVVDEGRVAASAPRIFALARDVERWPALLPHYRYVRFRERTSDGGGIVEMSANRPFGPANWPTWWLSQMAVVDGTIRFRHVGGVTKGMDVVWEFAPESNGAATHVRITHVWDGPPIPLLGPLAATTVIGPLFVHGIASRTLAGLTSAAERS